MSTLSRYLLRQIAGASLLVLVLMLGLIFFLDMINALSSPEGRLAFSRTLLLVALQLPARAYDVLPIAALTGAVFALTSLAANSEFTVMRMSGLGPRRALRLLLQIGLLISALIFAVGEWAAPAAERASAALAASGQIDLDRSLASGLWLRDRKDGHDEQMINVGRVSATGQLQQLHIYVLDADDHLLQTVQAASAEDGGDGNWKLHQATITRMPTGADAAVVRVQQAELNWPTSITPGVINVALLNPDHMSTLDLWRYVQHLRSNGQSVEREEIALWHKLLYPFGAVVMMLLALPFAYLHTRSGQISWKVFAGIMIGISFTLVNLLASRLGLLVSWPTWLSAALPDLLYGSLALAFFVWRVQFR